MLKFTLWSNLGLWKRRLCRGNWGRKSSQNGLPGKLTKGVLLHRENTLALKFVAELAVKSGEWLLQATVKHSMQPLQLYRVVYRSILPGEIASHAFAGLSRPFWLLIFPRLAQQRYTSFKVVGYCLNIVNVWYLNRTWTMHLGLVLEEQILKLLYQVSRKKLD